MPSESRPLTTFSNKSGHYQLTYAHPYCIKVAQAAFTSLMRQLLDGIANIHNYFDDEDNWEETLTTLDTPFKWVRKARLRIKPKKSELGIIEITFVGHEIGKANVEQQTENLVNIQGTCSRERFRIFYHRA